MRKIRVDGPKEDLAALRAGESVLITGYVYTSRDAAHKRIFSLIEQGKPLPYEIAGAFIYYAGPTPERPGMAIGSCGPTTSGRMDPYAPSMYDMGLYATIGKGIRSKEVKEAIIRNGAVYFAALGGAGALCCERIKSCEVIGFDDLGCESVKRLYLEDFPAVVAIDATGADLYESGPKAYAAR